MPSHAPHASPTPPSSQRRPDPRIALLWLLAFIVSIGTLRDMTAIAFCAYLAAGLLVAALGRMPVRSLLMRALWLLPVVGLFSLVVYLSGDMPRAASLLAKTYLSLFAVLVTLDLSPFPGLLAAAASFRFPPFLLQVTELIYRYLYTLRAEAERLQVAFRARAGRPGVRAIAAASGMVAVLFGRSNQKAQTVHYAMLARGSSLGIPARVHLRALQVADYLLLCVGVALLAGARVWLGK